MGSLGATDQNPVYPVQNDDVLEGLQAMPMRAPLHYGQVTYSYLMVGHDRKSTTMIVTNWR